MTAAQDKKDAIRTISVEVGVLSGVSAELLRYWMEFALEESGLSRASVEITAPPARVKCECGTEYETEDIFAACPECGGFLREVLGGMDLIIKSVEIEEETDGQD